MNIASATRRRLLLVTTLSLLTVGAVAAPGSSLAKDGDVIRTGSCSGATDWKLKLSKEDGRIEVEFEVDQNRNGKTWDVKLRQDGSTFWSGAKTTKAPSGSFEVRKLASDRSGVHGFTGRAVNRTTGEICRGTASI